MRPNQALRRRLDIAAPEQGVACDVNRLQRNLQLVGLFSEATRNERVGAHLAPGFLDVEICRLMNALCRKRANGEPPRVAQRRHDFVRQRESQEFDRRIIPCVLERQHSDRLWPWRREGRAVGDHGYDRSGEHGDPAEREPSAPGYGPRPAPDVHPLTLVSLLGSQPTAVQVQQPI